MYSYVSRELTHFVGRKLPPAEQYCLLVKILRSGRLSHPPHRSDSTGGEVYVSRTRRISDGQLYKTGVICFCDIPVPLRGIHMRKYGEFGISFPKHFLITRGASPVFYVASTSMVRDLTGNSTSRADYFDEKVRAYQDLVEELSRALGSQNADVLRVVNRWLAVQHMLDFHVFSMIRFFDPALDDTDTDNYYMEREWRLYGNLEFRLADVVRITLPRAYKDRLATDLPDFGGSVNEAEDVTA